MLLIFALKATAVSTAFGQQPDIAEIHSPSISKFNDSLHDPVSQRPSASGSANSVLIQLQENSVFDNGQSPADPMVFATDIGDHGHWWDQKSQESILDRPEWVTFGLDTILLDTLDSSPRIQIVASQASVAIEKIVQQDAAFDPTVLFDSRAGRNNDPVGSSLTTGGPPRLIENSLTGSAGIRRSTRRGGSLDVSQEIGVLDSNSNFFDPENQGNAKLSLSMTQPLMARSGQVYNERLLTQARLDGRVSWQQMRGEVETRISDVIAAYWKLYELRCHYIQTVELLQRGQRIEAFLLARMDFDAGEIELAKVRGRVARRIDREVRLRSEIKKQQATLAVLVGSEELSTALGQLELIPSERPGFPAIQFSLRDAVQTGIESRPEIRAATTQLEAAGLSIQITRTELEPKIAAVMEAYLAGLNGNYGVFPSWADQFSTGGPGLAAGLQYELPYGRRAARARHREAQHRYRLRSEELREAVQQARAEIEIALVSVNAAIESQTTKRDQWETAVAEEEILAGRWELAAGEGASVGVVLETLLDAQTRRTDAEKDLVSTQVEYIVSLVRLQRAMGTLLTGSGVAAVQDPCDNTIQFLTTDETIQGRQSNVGIPNSQMSTTLLPGATSFRSDPLRYSDSQSDNETIDQEFSLFEVVGTDAPVVQLDAEPMKFDDANQVDIQLAAPQKDLLPKVGPMGKPPVIEATLESTKVELPVVEFTTKATTTRADIDRLVDSAWLEKTMFGDTDESK